jgi:hypothetical protein
MNSAKKPSQNPRLLRPLLLAMAVTLAFTFLPGSVTQAGPFSLKASSGSSGGGPEAAYKGLAASISNSEDILFQILVLGQTSEIHLLTALGMKDLATAAKKKKKNLKSAESKSAAIAAVSAEDPAVDKAKNKALAAAAGEQREFSAAQEEALFEGFLVGVQVVFSVVNLVQATINIGTSMVSFGLSLANPMDAVAFSKAGYKPKVIKADLDSRFGAIKSVMSRIDKQAKVNDKTFKKIMKVNKLKPPKAGKPKALEASSEM